MVSFTSAQQFAMSAKVRHVLSDEDWRLSIVYGPDSDTDRPTFLEELHASWMICGDFNMIYHSQDKNNAGLHRRRMGQFCRFINQASLKEIHLEGRLFTWSNERLYPTLKRIDRYFITPDWETLSPGHELLTLPSHCSDHTPSLLHMDATSVAKKRFMFLSFWPSFPGFQEGMERAW
jgi:hypothetical protein